MSPVLAVSASRGDGLSVTNGGWTESLVSNIGLLSLSISIFLLIFQTLSDQDKLALSSDSRQTEEQRKNSGNQTTSKLCLSKLVIEKQEMFHHSVAKMLPKYIFIEDYLCQD